MTFIIAECGVNFENDDEAISMIDAAKRAGADYVKFQIYDHDNLCKVYGGEVERNPHYDELMEIRIDEARLKVLKDQADKIGIEFIATPMYLEAVDMLEAVGAKRYKIRYADRYNIKLLEAVQATGKPIILSCGWEFITDKPSIVRNNRDQFTLMYCIPEYPPDVQTFDKSPCTYATIALKGYSNHYPSIIPPLIAAARGAEIIEVHVKLNGTKPIDDAVSIDMIELTGLCRRVQEMEEYL